MQGQDDGGDDRQHRERERRPAVAEHARLRRGEGGPAERDADDGGRVRAEGARQRGRRRARRHRAGAPLLRRRGGHRGGRRDRAARPHGRSHRRRRRLPVPRVAARPLRHRRARCSCTAAARNPRTWTPRREPCATDAHRRLRRRRGRRRDRRARCSSTGTTSSRSRAARTSRRCATAGCGSSIPTATVTLPVPVVDDPARIDWRADDVVLVTTKTQDSTGAFDALAAAAGPDVPVVCAQNGVENERIALRRFAHVYAICVMLPARASRARRRRRRRRRPSAGCSTSAAIRTASTTSRARSRPRSSASTFESIPRPDIMRWKYRKLLMNLANAVEALCAPGDDAIELGRLARREGSAVLRGRGHRRRVDRRGSRAARRPARRRAWRAAAARRGRACAAGRARSRPTT